MALRRGIVRAVFIGLGIGITGIGGTIFSLGWDTVWAAQQLETVAVSTVATIEAKDERSVRGGVKGGQPEYRPDYFVTYRFTAGDGVEHSSEVGVSPTFFFRAAVGDTTPVRYLPANPKRSEVEFGHTGASSLRPLLFGGLGILVGVAVAGVAIFRPAKLDG